MELDEFYLEQDEPNRSCFLSLRTVILKAHQNISETKKYGMPCFTYSKKALCYLWKDKKTFEPYILFVEGRQMDHPSLEQGDRSRMKILRIDPKQDLKLELIEELLAEAMTIAQSSN